MKISFVIPCYRSERTLGGVVSEVKSVLAQRPETDYEFVLVSDHSPDNVWNVICELHAADPVHIKGIEFTKNYGQNSALMAGFGKSVGDIVFSMDDDGQAPVDDLFKVVDKLQDGPYDVVYGSYPDKRHNAFRNIGSNMNHLMAVWLLGKPSNVHGSSFYAVRRVIIEEAIKYRGPFPYIDGLLYRITKSVATVDVNHRERVDGVSGYTFAKLLGLWMNGFTSFSVKPLRLATWMGVVSAALGFMFGVFVVIKKLLITPDMAIGYSSIMAVLLFVGGMLMLILGLIGEYIGRIFICINQSPQYVIARTTND